MDSFIIRILRRSDKELNSMTGIIEDVNNHHKQGFNNQEELWEILMKSADELDGQDDCITSED